MELVNLSRTLIHRLNDRALTPQHSGYDVLKSQLTEIEGLLEGWVSYGFLKRFFKRKAIKAGIAEYVRKLDSIEFQGPVTPPTPVYPPGNPILTTSGRRSEGTVTTEGATNDSASALATTGYLNHEPFTVEPETTETHSTEGSSPPPIKVLNGEITRQGNIPFAEGTYCEVWMGRWEKGGWERVNGDATGKDKSDRKKVALKTLRILKPPERVAWAREKLERDIPGWAELRHQNILPFYGVVTNLGSRLYMVFPWREHGNLLEFVMRNRKADKNYLLRGSAAGLSYLHSRGLVHGSVKCKNVLVSPEGEPQICDFGIAKIIHETHDNTVSKTVSSTTIVRHAAPELIKDNKFPATARSDTYSFAMLVLECITEEMPFSNIPRDATVIHARISKKQCPPRPEHGVSDELWELMNRCWSIEPEERPPMDHVHRFFLDRA